MNVALDFPKGYILEVDLEYPQDLHNAHTDLPFCPINCSANRRTNLATLRTTALHYTLFELAAVNSSSYTVFVSYTAIRTISVT